MWCGVEDCGGGMGMALMREPDMHETSSVWAQGMTVAIVRPMVPTRGSPTV